MLLTSGSLENTGATKCLIPSSPPSRTSQGREPAEPHASPGSRLLPKLSLFQAHTPQSRPPAPRDHFLLVFIKHFNPPCFHGAFNPSRPHVLASAEVGFEFRPVGDGQSQILPPRAEVRQRSSQSSSLSLTTPHCPPRFPPVCPSPALRRFPEKPFGELGKPNATDPDIQVLGFKSRLPHQGLSLFTSLSFGFSVYKGINSLLFSRLVVKTRINCTL